MKSLVKIKEKQILEKFLKCVACNLKMVKVNDSINSNDDKTKKTNKSPKKSPKSPNTSTHIHRIYSCAELESNNTKIKTSKLLIFVFHCFHFIFV